MHRLSKVRLEPTRSREGVSLERDDSESGNGDAIPAGESALLTAELLPEEAPEATWTHPEIISDSNGAAASRASDLRQAITFALEATTNEPVKESPTDAPMRMAGVERVN